jgi:hypothetical protein
LRWLAWPQFLPAFHETLGTQVGISAQLGFELEGADGAPGVA